MLKYDIKCPGCGKENTVSVFEIGDKPSVELMADEAMYKAMKGRYFWTTEPPTEPGWYWVNEKGEAKLYRLLDDGMWQESDTVFDTKSGIENWGMTHWLGPLPVPELPE